MTLQERAEKYVKEVGDLCDKQERHPDSEDLEGAYLAGFREAIALALAGVEREKQYHEFLDEKGEMRHPILACKEIDGYLRAMVAESETPPGACL